MILLWAGLGMKLTKIKKSRMKCSSHELEKYTILFPCWTWIVSIAPFSSHLSHPNIYTNITLCVSSVLRPAGSELYKSVSRQTHTLPAYLHTHVHNIAFTQQEIGDENILDGHWWKLYSMRMLLDCINYIVISWSGLDVY